jgi:hypothetical protein
VEVSIFIKIFFGIGLVIATVMFLVKRAGHSRVVSPMNGGLNQNYDLLYQRLSDEGFEIEEFEPLDGRQLNVFLDHPRKSHFLFIGVFLLVIGILPGIVWFIFGRDKFSITLREKLGFVHSVFESNSKYASKAWQKVNLRLTMEKLGPPPENLQTTVEVIRGDVDSKTTFLFLPLFLLLFVNQ